MKRAYAVATAFALSGSFAGPAWGATALTVPAGGGLGALAVSVDVAGKSVRYASCKSEPCAVTDASPVVAIPITDAPIEASHVRVDFVVLAGGRHIAHVKVAVGATEPEAPAWEALLVSGSAVPLFAGWTGWRHGEPGERSGTVVQFWTEPPSDESNGDVTVVIGEIREDFRICGEDATLLDPRGLDPATLIFHGATLQRLSFSRRRSAIPVSATPRHAGLDPTLAPLLAATEASSALDAAHGAAALTDGDLGTAWVEGRSGRGQGELVLLRASYDVPIVRFAVVPTPRSRRPEGAAPETFYLATNAGTYEVTLPEDAWSHPGEAYDITLPHPIQTSCVALVLDDAFTRGRAHPEVTVAELTAYSAFDHAGAGLGELTAAMKGGDAKAEAAAALLERAGAPGITAVIAAYATLDAPGRALAMKVASSAPSCAVSAPLLTAALGDADAVVRRKALTKLEEPACGRDALPALTAGLKVPATRANVAPVVALLGREKAVGALVDVLGDGTPEERHALRSAVASAARAADPDVLRASLDSASKRSPEAALDALRALRDRLADLQTAADAAIAMVLARAPSVESRYLLVDVLGPLAIANDASAQAHLAEAILRDPAPEVRAHAAELVASASQPEATVAGALADAEPRVREAVLRSVAASRQGAVVTTVVTLLAKDPWTFVRVAAAAALAGLPASSTSDSALAEALDQRAPRVREQAVLALAAHGATGYRGVVRKHLEDAAEDPAVRVAAAQSLGVLCDAKAVDDLAKLAALGASSPDPGEVTLGLVATEALGAIHPKDLAARFAPLSAKGARPDARAAAARALVVPGRCPLP